MKPVRGANGARFESEFSSVMSLHHHVLRLPTLNTGYSGLSQPADFIVVGDAFNYVELKETTSDRFSLSDLQQARFLSQYNKEKAVSRDPAFLLGHYYLVIHFVLHKVYVVVTSTKVENLMDSHKSVRWDSKDAIVFRTLEDLCKELPL